MYARNIPTYLTPPFADVCWIIEMSLPKRYPNCGEAIRVELERRGWTHDDLARVLGMHRPEVTNIIAGKRAVTPEVAVSLAAVFPPTTAEDWLSMENARQLSLLAPSGEIASRRARAYTLAPIRDLEKRGWIAPTKTDAELEREVCRFLAIPSIEADPTTVFAMRKSGHDPSLTVAERAWCMRARHLTRSLPVNTFSPNMMGALRDRLRRLAAYPKEATHLQEVMGDFGIRFCVIEPIPGARIDGAAFWLDEQSPAVAVTIRHDRIDSFWFTVLHEIQHIAAGDAASVDSDLTGDDYRPSSMKDDIERRADEGASATLVPPEELASFMRRVSPLYSKDRIVQFAHRIKMHPGIIVGQLQHLGEIGYSANREMLVKIRHIVTETSLTDGYGRVVAPRIG